MHSDPFTNIATEHNPTVTPAAQQPVLAHNQISFSIAPNNPTKFVRALSNGHLNPDDRGISSRKEPSVIPPVTNTSSHNLDLFVR